MAETYLGLDFGGTKLMIGEVDSLGNILRSKQYPTGYCSQQQAVDIMCSSLDDYLAEFVDESQRPKAIGVGMIGRIDSVKGEWLQIDPQRDDKVKLASLLSERYGMPSFIDNDVKSATRAEMLWGKGRYMNHFIYINVGTGIAAGAVVNGQIVSGAHFDAGEVGYMYSNVNVTPENHREYIEDIASGSGFDRCARRLISEYPGTTLLIPKEGRVNVKNIFEEYQKGDALCHRLVENAAESLATLVTNLIRAYDPEGIVLGGGVVSDGLMLDLVKQRLNPMSIRFLSQGITLTELDPHFVGLLGAAAVAYGNSKE